MRRVEASEPRSSIVDVARAAGVSASTVSRVLSSPDFGRAETRSRVLAAARELAWNRTRTPRADASGVGTIGVMLSQLENPFFAQLATALLESAHRHDYSLLLGDIDSSLDDVAEFARQCDALVAWAPSVHEPVLAELVGHAPTVMLNGERPGSPSVIADGADVVAEVVDYLVTLGHRHIGYATTTEQSASLRSRLESARRRSELRGVGFTILSSSGTAAQSVKHSADLAVAAGVTAVLAQNDLAAMALIREFSQRGLTIPGDISVVGCDDNPAARLCLPSVTTIAIPLADIAETAIRLVRSCLAGGPSPAGEHRLPSRLVVRESTGPAPGTARRP